MHCRLAVLPVAASPAHRLYQPRSATTASCRLQQLVCLFSSQHRVQRMVQKGDGTWLMVQRQRMAQLGAAGKRQSMQAVQGTKGSAGEQGVVQAAMQGLIGMWMRYNGREVVAMQVTMRAGGFPEEVNRASLVVLLGWLLEAN